MASTSVKREASKTGQGKVSQIKHLRNPLASFVKTATAASRLKAPAAYESEIARLVEVRNSLFGLEEKAREKVVGQISSLEHDLALAKASSKGLSFKYLSLEPLAWLDGRGFPVFAVYGLGSPFASLGPKVWGAESNYQPTLPPEMRKQYEPVVRSLAARNQRITSRFEGVIPAAVRAQIKEVQPVFGANLFVVAEANWTVAQHQAPKPVVRRDPLVVGWDGGRLRLIAKFDLTDLEKYVVAEFPA